MTQKIVAMHAAYASKGKLVDGFLARPLLHKPAPALVLLHGYRGVDEAQRAVTRKFAAAGFVCLSPDLFEGKISRNPVTSAYLKTSLDIERAVQKAIDSVDYLRSLPFVGKRKIALSGFCMGGGLALYGLARSDKFAAGVIFYQSLFPDPAELKSIQAPLQCHYGTNDHNTTQAEIDMFRETLEACGKKFEIHMYEEASHGFLNSGGKKSEIDRLASDRALAKSCAWLKRALA